jgi:RNA-binding protein 25
MEWIDNLRRHGIDVNLEDMKKREMTGEPLEWELQLISKDSETRKLIFDILTQKNEIEMYAKQNEKPEEYLKDLKDLTSTTSSFSQHFESEREKERERKKSDKIKKLEKLFKEEEKRWERHEEDMERDRKREIEESDDLLRRKKRLIEKDLNYDTDEEKKKIKQNPRKYEERRIMRERERESDAQMRKKENPSKNENQNDILINDEVTDLALVDGNTQLKEPESKAVITYQEYNDEDENHHDLPKTFFSNQNISLNLNVEAKKPNKPSILNDHEDDYDAHDPYHKKKICTFVDFNPETEKEILEMNKTAIFYPPEESKIPEPKEKMPESENISSQGQKTSSSMSVLNLDKNKGLLELHKQIYEQIPKSTDELLKFPINWNVITKYDILENKIKPWLGKKLVEYIGEDEPNLKNMIIKKLAQKSSAYELMEKIKPVFEEDTEVTK